MGAISVRESVEQLTNIIDRLLDGDFLRIKGIIKNTWTQSITLRGDRLQRVKHLNGMLEKKLNEAVLFVEVDLDDPRRLNNQAAIEVPIAEVLRLRNVRFTNLKFPLARNFDLSHFNSIDKAADQGGLTCVFPQFLFSIQ